MIKLRKTITLLVTLQESEMSYRQHRLKIFDNGVLTSTFGLMNVTSKQMTFMPNSIKIPQMVDKWVGKGLRKGQ
jgi:hypothetical protein